MWCHLSAGHQVPDIHAIKEQGVVGDEPPVAPPPNSLAAHDCHRLSSCLGEELREGE